MSLAVWFSFWLTLNLFNSAFGETTPSFPKAPISPTYEQCTLLGQQYQAILRDLHEKMSTCMNQNPPTIGRYQNCAGKQAITAWVQCSDIDVDQCKVEAIRQKELENCRAKAHGPSDRDTEMATALKKANSSYEQVRDMVQLIQNPQVFLRKNLTHYPSTITKLFGSNRPEFDADLAQEVYRYAHNQSKELTELAPNKIIKKIQQAALQHIANVHKNMIHEINKLSENMNYFEVENSESNQKREIEQRYKPNEELCLILGTC